MRGSRHWRGMKKRPIAIVMKLEELDVVVVQKVAGSYSVVRCAVRQWGVSKERGNVGDPSLSGGRDQVGRKLQIRSSFRAIYPVAAKPALHNDSLSPSKGTALANCARSGPPYLTEETPTDGSSRAAAHQPSTTHQASLLAGGDMRSAAAEWHTTCAHHSAAWRQCANQRGETLER
jgi:hypothetical protein